MADPQDGEIYRVIELPQFTYWGPVEEKPVANGNGTRLMALLIFGFLIAVIVSAIIVVLQTRH